MGELIAILNTMKKEREERLKALESNRVQYATDLLTEAMYAVDWNASEKVIIYLQEEQQEKPYCKTISIYRLVVRQRHRLRTWCSQIS